MITSIQTEWSAWSGPKHLDGGRRRNSECLLLGGFKKNHRDYQLSRKQNIMGSTTGPMGEELQVPKAGLILGLARTCWLTLDEVSLPKVPIPCT